MIRFAFFCVVLAACGDPPSIESLSILETMVDEEERVPVTVVAGGPGLTIEWTASAGSFVDAAAAETTWIAPLVSDTSHEPATALHTITVTVTNEDGSKADSLEVTVNNLNETPRIVSATASDDSPLPGDTLSLTVVAEDGDDPDLTYEWRQLSPSAKLEITGVSAESASVVLPVAAQAVAYEFSITVKDPGEAEAVRAVNFVAIVPTFATDVLPTLSASGSNCGSCHRDGAGGLTLDPDDADAIGATYDVLVQTGGNTVGTIACDPGAAGSMEYPYVTPGQPEMSGLFLKISRDIVDSGCDGSRMPASDTGYFDTNADQLALIESWILAGAPND